jgi:hypothetical protein
MVWGVPTSVALGRGRAGPQSRLDLLRAVRRRFNRQKLDHPTRSAEPFICGAL